MATFNFSDLFSGGGNLGNIFGGGMSGETPTGLDALLSEDQRKLLGRNATLSAAAALLQAGAPSATPIGLGQALGSALQAGQQGYQQARLGSLQDLLLGQKLEEAKAERDRKAQVSKLFPQVFTNTLTPAQQTIYGKSAPVVYDENANLMPGAEMTPAASRLTIDPNKLQALAMLSADPIASLSQIAKLVPDLNRAGFTGAGMSQDNPFSIFTGDNTIPQNLRNLALQYEKSYKSGLIDPEKADERVRQLATSIESQRQFEFGKSQQALQFAQTAAGQAESRLFAQNQAAALNEMRKQAEANKPEQFSFAQKKDFEVVNRANENARSAVESGDIANRAIPLVNQAYGGKIESTLKNIAGAIGYSTDAKDANDALLRFQNQLSVKTPKFSGSTSNADATRYDKAVGDLANSNVSGTAKLQALKEIIELSAKAVSQAQQQENYFYNNNKSLRGFTFTPTNPFEQ